MEPINTPTNVRIEKALCAECGTLYPKDELLSFGKFSICSNCKPIFQQKLSEGSFTGGTMQFSSARRRFAAIMIDGLISWIFFGIGMFLFAAGTSKGMMGVLGSGWVSIITTPLGLLYQVLFIGKYGATPGKMAMGIKVVRANGNSVGYGLAFGRYFAQLLNTFTFGIGYLMAVWDKEKRGLHDRICGTRVIHI